MTIPFIDKISITIKLPSEIANIVNPNVEEFMKVKSIFQWAKASPDFKYSRMISLSGTVERVLFQYGAKKENIPDCRIEFNPHNLGPDSMDELNMILSEIFPGGWQYIVKHGGVSRIDVAVDIPGVRMDEFLLLEPHGCVHQRFLRNGHLQTLYAGLPHGNQTRIYSKSAQMKAKGFPIAHSTARVECIRRNTHLKVHELAKLSNPFAKLVMTHHIPPPPPWENENRWSRFQDSVIVRGLGPALALLPEKRRAAYRKYFKQNPEPWWKPDAIWAHWPNAVQVLM